MLLYLFAARVIIPWMMNTLCWAMCCHFIIQEFTIPLSESYCISYKQQYKVATCCLWATCQYIVRWWWCLWGMPTPLHVPVICLVVCCMCLSYEDVIVGAWYPWIHINMMSHPVLQPHNCMCWLLAKPFCLMSQTPSGMGYHLHFLVTTHTFEFHY